MHRAEIDFPRVSPQGMQRILIGVGGVHIQERRDFTLDISTVDCLRSRDLDLSTADITFWYPIWRKGNARNIRGWCTNRHATLCGIGSANVPKMANEMRWTSRSRSPGDQDLRVSKTYGGFIRKFYRRPFTPIDIVACQYIIN